MIRKLSKSLAISALASLSISLALAQGSTPPQLEVVGWTNAGEKGFKLDQARGKVVLLAFMSGFC